MEEIAVPNPVLGKFDGAANRPGGAMSTPSAGQLNDMYNRPAFTPTEYMTLDDVVVRTGVMLATILGVGALTWSLSSTSVDSLGNRVVSFGSISPLLLIGFLGGLGLGLYMAFTMKANAFTALAYSACEGVVLGAVSRYFDARYPGVAIQALTGTVMVAIGMLVVYKTGAIRVTPRFTKMIVGATLGVFGLMIINLVASFFTDGGLGLRTGGPLAVVFSLFCIGLAAFNLVIDFDMIERAIRSGADRKFAWYASFGIVVTLVWLYLEILRLLGYARR
jgi:uncharacterized YccA/Bax inhibitor family protein